MSNNINGWLELLLYADETKPLFKKETNTIQNKYHENSKTPLEIQQMVGVNPISSGSKYGCEHNLLISNS